MSFGIPVLGHGQMSCGEVLGKTLKRAHPKGSTASDRSFQTPSSPDKRKRKEDSSSGVTLKKCLLHALFGVLE